MLVHCAWSHRVANIGLALLLALSSAASTLAVSAAPTALAQPAAGVVGTGLPASCSESALLAALAGGGNITFNCGPLLTTITLTAAWQVTTTTSLDGAGLITLSGAQTTRLFVVLNGASLSLQNLTLTHGYGLDLAGGAIENFGHLNLLGVTLTGNESAGNTAGGAIANRPGGTTEILNSQFSNNQATDGGAIYNAGVMTVTNTTVENNTATNAAGGGYGGGGILQELAATLTLSHTVLRANSVSTPTATGGGLNVHSGLLLANDVVFENNTSAGGGGGLRVGLLAAAWLTNTRFINNTTPQPASDDRFGGAVLNLGALSLVTTTLTGNSANRGGGLWSSGSAYLQDVTVSGNAVSNLGGGLLLTGTTRLVNTTISGNTAGQAGGGLYAAVMPGLGLTITQVTLANNGPVNLYVAAGTQAPWLLNSLVVNPLSGASCFAGTALASGGHNLASDTSCALSGAGDLNNTNPQLAGLNDNGGPTYTHLPAATSPAVNAFSGASCAGADQRGVARPQGGSCDIGAVEVGGTFTQPPLVEPIGIASDYAVVGNTLYWRTPADCAANPARPETLNREPVQGSDPPRVIYQNNAACTALQAVAASGEMRSNVIADADYLYWTTDAGLYRLPLQAAPDTPPQLWTTDMSGPQQLTQTPISIYGLDPNHILHLVIKEFGAGTNYAYIGDITDVQASYVAGKEYVYYLLGGALKRKATTGLNPGPDITLATGVSAYRAIGSQKACRLTSFLSFTCTEKDIVLYSQGLLVRSYDNLSQQTADVYLAAQPIYELAFADGYLFTLEEQTAPCQYFGLTLQCRRLAVGRVPLNYSGLATLQPKALIYQGQPSIFRVASQLQAGNGYVFWREGLAIKQYPYDATALPNVQVTGLEVTQGIQRPDNSVPILRNRRTVVRLFARTTHGQPLSGVGATLRVYANGVLLGTLNPSAPSASLTSGTLYVIPSARTITVQPNPQRALLTQQFLFDLPIEWTSYTNLNFVGEVNPARAPVETRWDDNVIYQAVTLENSRRLTVQFVYWRYHLPGDSNTLYAPPQSHVDAANSYLRRTYPIATRTDLPDQGLNPLAMWITNDELGKAVARDATLCATLPLTTTAGIFGIDGCATTYSNQKMKAMRVRSFFGIGLITDIPSTIFMFGMISDTSQSRYFVRGLALGNESSGPTGAPRADYAWWDTDFTYGDTLVAHEVGHSLGLPHPRSGHTTVQGCALYDTITETVETVPYLAAHLGASPLTEGFDMGDAALGLPRRTYPSQEWHDLMSYCPNAWMSDWTYEHLHATTLAPTAQYAAANSPSASNVMLSGNWLLVQGGLSPNGSGAVLSNLERLPAVTELPSRIAGDYALELRGAGGGLLASYPFVPETETDGNGERLLFTLVVTDVAGSAAVHLVRLSDHAVLAQQPLSPHAPSVSNVVATVAPDGNSASLTWMASDSDGDPLSFDVYYSLDGGQTFAPVALSLTSPQATLDTSWLSGGSAFFQVFATDGSNTARANSPVFTMPIKTPVPTIFSPASGQSLPLGAALNLEGQAYDYQQGYLGESALSWHSITGTVGTGASLTLFDLPLGTHTLTLTAINIYGITASTSVTVSIVDALDTLGPTLAAATDGVTFSFDNNATQPQTATVSLANIGSGELSWTVMSRPFWLTVDVVTGTLPISGTGGLDLLLTADPTLLPNTVITETALIFLALPFDAPITQTVSLRVLAAKGLSLGGNGLALQRVFLPMVRK